MVSAVPFKYYAPQSLDEALDILDKFGERAKILAGGQSLVPLMKLRVVTPEVIVDIFKYVRKKISYIEKNGNTLRIGALVTHNEIISSRLVGEMAPMLAEAAKYIGDYQVRNRGTIGGSACHADPAANYLPALMALGAQFVIKGRKGERIVNAEDFFIDAFTTALRPGEILTEIRVPSISGYKWGYAAVQRRAGDYALVASAVLLKLEDSRVDEARIVVGAATPRPMRFREAEEILEGKELNESAIATAADKVYEGLKNPLSDIKASGDYRRIVAKMLVKSTLLSMLRGGG
jgi:CO/xanthine dehydrogenase FAD-binding subunit